MTKRAQSKKQKNTSKDVAPKNKLVRFWKSLSTLQKILIDFAIFIVVGLIIYFSYAWYQGYMFRRVEKKMDTLTQEIIEEIGEPISQTKDQTCGHTSAKYSKGQLWCRSSHRLEYRIAPGDNTTISLINGARETIKKNAHFRLDSVSDLRYLDKFGTGDKIYKSYFSNCYTSYQYGEYDKKVFTLSISCSNNPLRPEYPVKA